jgi:hypothetical protein
MAYTFPSFSTEQQAASARLYGTVEAIRLHSYNKGQAQTDANRAKHFETTFFGLSK